MTTPSQPTPPIPTAPETAKPLGIAKLIALIGDENIQFQNVMANLLRVDNPKHRRCSKITVTIAPEVGQELAAAAMAEQPPRKTGLILWFDTDKIPKL